MYGLSAARMAPCAGNQRIPGILLSPRRTFDALMERRTASIPRIDLPLEQRLELVRRYGDFSLAYSTAVQKDLSYFGDAEGYIAFGSNMGSAFALADPVAEP